MLGNEELLLKEGGEIPLNSGTKCLSQRLGFVVWRGTGTSGQEGVSSRDGACAERIQHPERLRQQGSQPLGLDSNPAASPTYTRGTAVDRAWK